MAFNNVYRGKKVLITGNTGFKGSWLSAWLLMLGAATGRRFTATLCMPYCRRITKRFPRKAFQLPIKRR